MPTPALAPVMPPVIVPIFHSKLLDTDADKFIPGLVPVQIVNAAGVVTAAAGLTVTVIIYGKPAQEPLVEVGVTI